MLKIPPSMKNFDRREWYLAGSIAIFWVIVGFQSLILALLYPLLVVIPISLYVRDKRNWKEAMQNDEIRDLVHQFRAPLLDLKMACEHIGKNPENRELVTTMVKRIPPQVDGLLALTVQMSQSKKEPVLSREGAGNPFENFRQNRV